jgi:1A family penicillin-binding protein
VSLRFKKILQIIILSCMILFFLVMGIVGGMVIAYWNDLPSLDSLDYEAKAWQYPTKVYSDISRIVPGNSLKNLLRRLERLSYVKIDGQPNEKGQYSLVGTLDNNDNRMFLNLRDLVYPISSRLTIPARLLDIQISGGKISTIKENNGVSVNEFILEPEVIGEFYGTEGTDRELVTLSEIPAKLSEAFIAIEDKRFYKHFGFDLYRIFGAIWWDAIHFSKAQGASTITQQLARDLFLTKEKIFTRKIKEALLAIKIEQRYTKDEILERYLNRINLGRYGSREIYGVGQAAKYYFGKTVGELNIQECATLAGIVKSPPKYSPIKNPDSCLKRRQVVLKQMEKNGFINEKEYKEALATPLALASFSETSDKNTGYVLEFVRIQMESLLREYEPNALYRLGLRVYTSLDASMLFAADSAVQKGLNVMDISLGYPLYNENLVKWSAGERGKGIRDPESYIQSALVCIEPSTGYVRAMIGGRNFKVSQFNRAFQSKRSPGSSFKPFVYCAAFSSNPPLATPVTIVKDEQWSVPVPEGRWEPKNFNPRFYGQVTIRKILTKSINVATARFMYERVGVNKVIETAKKMGIESKLDRVPSLALGSSGTTLLEITSAYGVWDNQGIRVKPNCVKYVLDRDNNLLEENVPIPSRVLDKNVAFLMTHLMEGVIDEGTGQGLREMGFDRPAAGKTGTTNDEADAWFIGFVPELVTGVWVGFDDFSKSTNHTGARAALPIWYDFMKSAVDGPIKSFPVPEGIVFVDVDADTGRRATGNTSNVIKEAFVNGTEPR